MSPSTHIPNLNIGDAVQSAERQYHSLSLSPLNIDSSRQLPKLDNVLYQICMRNGDLTINVAAVWHQIPDIQGRMHNQNAISLEG